MLEMTFRPLTHKQVNMLCLTSINFEEVISEFIYQRHEIGMQNMLVVIA